MIIDFVQINKQLGKRYAMSFQYASMSVEARSLLKILTKSLAYKYPPLGGLGVKAAAGDRPERIIL
jgi:hypothetical protein